MRICMYVCMYTDVSRVLEEKLLTIWGETSYLSRREYLSSLYCTDEGSSKSLLNLGTGLLNPYPANVENMVSS